MFVRALLLSCLAAQPALALSCARPDVARSAAEAVQSDETFRIAVGTFSLDQDRMPETGQNEPGTKRRSIPATFEGNSLARDGFTVPISGEVLLEVECLGPWCGTLAPDTEMLVFLRQAYGRAVLDVSPCPQWTFDAPTPEQLETVRACVVDGACGTE